MKIQLLIVLNMKKNILLFCFVIALLKVESQCVTYYNGVTNDTEFKNAAEYLCNNGIIGNTFNVSHMYDWITRKELSVLLVKALFPNTIPSIDNYPYPFIDLNNISSFEKNAMLIMLHLEYPDKINSSETDGIPPLSREFFNARPNQAINYGSAMRMFLESFDYSIDWAGYDKNNSNFSMVYDDVRYNDPNYGYIRTAKFKNLHVNNTCIGWNFCPNDLITVRNAYVILYKIMNDLSNPRLNPQSYSQYFMPNTITSTSISSPVDINRGVFTHYEDQSFNIKGGGFPLEFTHSYFSHYTELPRYDRENVRNKLEFQRFNPLGHGWTHTYNINAQVIESTDLTQRKIYFWWNDGTADIYNYSNSSWESQNGRYLKIQTIAGVNGGTDIDTIWVTDKNHVRYKFTHKDLEATSYSLVEIRDRNDNTLTLNYETGNNLGTPYTAKRLKTVKDNVSGRSLTFYYSPLNNYITQVSDNSGRFVLFTVDQNSDDLVSFTDAENGKYTYSFGQNAYDKHLLKSISKPKGNIIYADYYKRKLKQTKSNNYVTDVSFQPNYTNTNISTNTKITITQNGQALAKNISHNEKGLVVQIQDSSQFLTYFYNDANNPTLPTHINDQYHRIGYSFSYDNRGNILSKRKGSFLPGAIQEEKYTYSPMWNLATSYTDPKGNTTSYALDNFNGNLWFITYPDNTKTTFDRNAQGNIKKITLPDDKTVTLEYNTYGNLSQYGYTGSSNQVKANYNSISNIESITDARGTKTEFIFDKNDNFKTKVDDANGLRETTNYQYDPNENLRFITDAENHQTVLNYDWNTDDLIQELDPENKSKKWTYNDDGSVKSYTFKNGITFSYDYFPKYDRNEGKLKSDDYNNYEYSYDKKDLIFVNKIGGKQIIIDKDALNRVSSHRYNDYWENANKGVRYTYDDNNNVKRITYPYDYFVEYTYDNRDRIKSVQANAGKGIFDLIGYDYYPSGNLKSEKRFNGVNTFYYYDNENRLDSLVTLDKNGGIIYAYKYELDENGNHLSETLYGLKPPFGISNDIDTIPRSYIYDKANQLTSYNGIPWSYNGNGAHTQRTDFTYTYDQRDNMLSSRVANNNPYGDDYDYEYDGLENRRRVNSTLHTLDLVNNSNVLLTASSSDPTNPYHMWVHGLGLACTYRFSLGQWFFYHYDSRGSTVAITNENGDVDCKYEYGTFGDISSESFRFVQPFKYVGKYGVQYDSKNLYFMRARMYNPYYGRFMSEDPIFSTNLYPYADNNPINRIDPSGKVVALAYPIAQVSIPVIIEGITYLVAAVGAYFILKQVGKYANVPPGDLTRLKNGQGWRDRDGNVWKKDQKHKDHWDVTDPKTGKKIKEVDFDGEEIWPNGPKNKNK